MNSAIWKIKVLPLERKANMIREVTGGEKKVADRYQIALSMLSTILTSKNGIMCAPSTA